MHLSYLVILFICISRNAASIDTNLSPSKSLVYGLGLNGKLVFPARYFFIQAVNNSGNNITESIGDVFTVQISSTNGHCRAWAQVLDRGDGSYLVRYRQYEFCRDALIKISYKDEPVGKSPYVLSGPVYQEECDCPQGSFNDWLEAMGCPDSYKQIDDDLEQFSYINMDHVLEEMQKRFNHAGSHSLCNYVVLHNQIYRKCYGQHVGFKMFMDNILLSMARKVILPNMEFIANLGDWPLDKEDAGKIPIFSWCGSDDTNDIVLPTYDLTESTLESMGRVMLDMMSIQSKTGPKWAKKISKGFWRGRDSRRDRLLLVYLARKNPDLLNASLTNFFFFQELEEEYGPKVPHISFFDFFEYKYQINIDGTVAAYRFPYLLAGDATVFKQDSKFYEHFYKDLNPMVHYVPFNKDLSDLLDKIKWAKRNDDKVQEISQNGRKFAQENLMAKDVFCYHAILFKKYAKMLVNKPVVRGGMEHVPQPKGPKTLCECNNLFDIPENKKDEL